MAASKLDETQKDFAIQIIKDIIKGYDGASREGVGGATIVANYCGFNSNALNQLFNYRTSTWNGAVPYEHCKKLTILARELDMKIEGKPVNENHFRPDKEF